jgi:PhnB protein
LGRDAIIRAKELCMTAVQIVTPHLVVRNAQGAIDFYQQALGATEAMRMPAPDGARLMHVEIQIQGARIFLVDHFPEHACGDGVEAIKPPDQLGGTPITIHLEVKDCDAAVARAKAAGATVTQEPWDAFWGARYARIVDPYGHSWSFSHPLPAAS